MPSRDGPMRQSRMHYVPWTMARLSVLFALAACGGHSSHTTDGNTGDASMSDAGVAICNHKDDPAAFHIEVPTITLSGAITINGAPAPTTERFGTVTLRELSSGDSLVLGQVGDPSYAPKQIVAGTYD